MTIAVTKSQKQTVCELAGRFPGIAARGVDRRPLKVGIFHDIVAAAPDIEAKQIKRALRWYVSGMHYLANLQEGAVRVGLDGVPAGTVIAAEAEHARGRLNAMLIKRRAKAAATPTAAAPAAPKVVRPAKAAAPKAPMGAPVNPAKAKSIAPAPPTGSPRIRASLAALREAARMRTSSHLQHRSERTR
jgi:ProP effector